MPVWVLKEKGLRKKNPSKPNAAGLFTTFGQIKRTQAAFYAQLGIQNNY
jgi:hypothetical protein